MRFSRKKIEEKTGLKAFNFGVFYGTVEDQFSISHALANSDSINPKLIILCLDPFGFREESNSVDQVFLGAKNRLSYFEPFSKYLPDYSPVKLNWFRIKSALTLKQTKDSFFALKNGNLKEKSPKSLFERGFYEDGTRKNYGDWEGNDITKIAESGEYKVEDYLKFKDKEFLKARNGYKGIVSVMGDYDFDGLSSRRIELLDSVIHFLADKNCKVAINIMPVQPYFYQLLMERTKHINNIDALNEACEKIKAKYNNVIVLRDNSKIENFNGEANHFFDAYHPTSVNSDYMIESLSLDRIKY